MSARDKKRLGSGETGTFVAEYLRRHPHFLSDNPEVLRSLFIPHDTDGNAISLIERQVQSLRLRIDELENRAKANRVEADTDRKLVSRTYRLTVAILRSNSPNEVYTELRQYLSKSYHADACLVYLFAPNRHGNTKPGLQILGPPNKIRNLFEEVFHRDRPLCDSLQEEHVQTLFGLGASAIHSTALVPLGGPGWDGLLALGSHKRNSYRRGFKIDVLAHICAITSLVLSRWLTAGDVKADLS